MKNCDHKTNEIICPVSAKIENGIACEKGEYKDFTGIIMWGDNEGVVENATFYLEDFLIKAIVFHNGVWKDGIWVDGTWKDGVWHNGVWQDGIWRDGTWKNGVWENGIWENGVWEKDTWKCGIWKNGIWKGGVDRNGKFHRVSPRLWTR